LLTFSPALLYFSRFARNDILMAAWALGLVISMWRYMDEGKNRYLYISAGLLALAFGTKESAYLVVATLGLFLTLQVGVPTLTRILKPVEIEGVSPPVAIGRVVRTLWSSYSQGFDFANISRPAAYLLLMISLTLPLWSAFAAIFQDTPLWSLVALRTDLLDHLDTVVHHISDQLLPRNPQWSLEFTGILGDSAGRRARGPTLVLLLCHNINLRVFACFIRRSWQYLFHPKTRPVQPVSGLLACGDIPLVHHRQRENALAVGKYYTALHRVDRKIPRRAC
jgi:hypothetical protein